LEDTRKKITAGQKETTSLNNRKLRAKSDKSVIKNQMLADMEDFSREMQTAKELISGNQELIIETIREKMNSQFATNWDDSHFDPAALPFSGGAQSAGGGGGTVMSSSLEFRETLAQSISRSDQDEVRALLAATGLGSVEELLADMLHCEDSIFRW
jgi:hypothetical protein